MSIVDQTLQSIKQIVTDYREWTAGQTANPQRSRQDNGSPGEWHCWDVGSHLGAHAIGTYLVTMGMQCKPPEDDGTFIYIFKSMEEGRMNVIVLIDKEKCTGCGECAKQCPKKILYVDKTTGKCSVTDETLCDRFLGCEDVCKTGAIRIR